MLVMHNFSELKSLAYNAMAKIRSSLTLNSTYLVLNFFAVQAYIIPFKHYFLICDFIYTLLWVGVHGRALTFSPQELLG